MTIKQVCPVCASEVTDVMKHMVAQRLSDNEHHRFLETVDSILASASKTRPLIGQLVELVRNSGDEFHCVDYNYVVNYLRQYQEPDRVRPVMYGFKSVEDESKSDLLNEEYVRIESLWMPGRIIRELPEIIVDYNYDAVRILSHYQQDTVHCECCGSDSDVRLTYVDSDYMNILVSNMQVLCASCQPLQGNKQITPTCSVVKQFSFASAHRLPNYQGNCNFLHGHEWQFEVCIQRMVNPTSGMVLDFKELKRIVSDNVVNLLDHGYLNDFLPNPTAENIVMWIWDRLTLDGLLKGLEYVKLWESPTSYVCLTKQDMLSTIRMVLGRRATNV